MKSVFLPTDDRGLPVHAHGGHILRDNGFFYFIGENRTGRSKVSCYRSKDLKTWEFRGNLLTVDSKTQKHYFDTHLELDIPGQKASIGVGCNIERPKVIYNEKTGKYVMWMHWEMPNDYREARCAVAVCDTIDGEYTYLGSFNPLGYMSRDCTLFKDDDGTAYFISAANNNADMHIYRLTDDYLAIDSLVQILWPGQWREAPTVFKKDGIYYMLTSGCTGWAPNQSSYAFARSMDGEWSERFNLGDETTYRSQPTCVICPENDLGGKYYYLGDRWGGGGENYFKSEYVLLPLTIHEDGRLSLEWVDDNGL